MAVVGVEVTAGNRDELLGLQRPFGAARPVSARVMVSLRPMIINSGVGETRETHCPGSYMRAARMERTVTLFS